MKEYLFSEEEVDLICFIKFNKPIKIWYDIIHFVFVYKDFYISFEVECLDKFILNETIEEDELISNIDSLKFFEQYAMALRIKKNLGIYISNEASEEISINEDVKEVFLVRSLYYYAKHKEIKGTKNKSFYLSSCIINPNKKNDKNIKVERKYLVDTGIVIQFENDTFLNCFLQNNDEDLAINSFWINDNLIESQKDKYDFLKICRSCK